MRKRANEVLCIHGTTKESASHIANQGFDDRLGNRELYGRGIYCTTDACKAAQYCNFGEGGCIILARALLGHPFLANGTPEEAQATAAGARPGHPTRFNHRTPRYSQRAGEGQGQGKGIPIAF